ncbi:MAG: RHS repeat protein, partial [Gammaproteobacteria bacterium]
MQSLAAPGGITLSYSYDGALVTSEILAGPVTGALTRSYDTNFRVQALSVNGASIAFGYDNDNLLTSAGSLSLTRDPDNGLLTGTVLGTVNDSPGYNGFGEVEDYSANHNSNALLNLHYTRDALGRITQKTETQGALTTTFNYAYDLAGR